MSEYRQKKKNEEEEEVDIDTDAESKKTITLKENVEMESENYESMINDDMPGLRTPHLSHEPNINEDKTLAMMQSLFANVSEKQATTKDFATNYGTYIYMYIYIYICRTNII